MTSEETPSPTVLEKRRRGPTPTPKARAWSTKTLGKNLSTFAKTNGLTKASTLGEVLDKIREQIWNEEVGETLTLE